MDTNRFNQILFVDSLPRDESTMARRLFDDIESYANAYPPSVAVTYVRAQTEYQLFDCINEARARAISDNVLPLLHLECHGDEEGIELADGAFVEWMALKNPITELNLATQLNLLVAVAACAGAAFAKAIRMSDRAPFWGLIGPTKALFAKDLDQAFRALYLTLLAEKSPAKAIAAMKHASEPNLIWHTTSRGPFEKGWANYRAVHCTAAALNARAKRMRVQAVNLGISPVPSVRELKTRLVNWEPQAFDQYRRIFFMYDVYPNHAERFPVTYVR